MNPTLIRSYSLTCSMKCLTTFSGSFQSMLQMIQQKYYEILNMISTSDSTTQEDSAWYQPQQYQKQTKWIASSDKPKLPHIQIIVTPTTITYKNQRFSHIKPKFRHSANMRQNTSLTQGWNPDQPTSIDIYNTIKAVQQKYPLTFRIVINKLYEKHVQTRLAVNLEKDHSFCGSITGSQSSARQSPIFNNPSMIYQKKLKPTATSQKVSSDKEDSSLPSISSDSQKTSSQQIQKEIIQKFKPTPTKYEVQEQFLRMKEKKQLNISGQVYDRFGKFQEKSQEKLPLKKIKGQNQQNIRRAQEWDKTSNKEYRIYANKVAPRFHTRNEEISYFQKRQFAKTFSERGYRIDRVKQVYSEKFAPENVQGRKNKTVSIGFVIDTYRRFQQFLMQDMRKNVRPLTGIETRYLYSVILTANEKFAPVQYDCFRKFAKIAFDLGSISVYEQDAIKLFLAIQSGLKQKIESGEKIDQQSFCPLPVKNISRLDIYAPKWGGGYEEEIEVDTQSLSLELDQYEIDDQELQLIDGAFDL